VPVPADTGRDSILSVWEAVTHLTVHCNIGHCMREFVSTSDIDYPHSLAV